MHLTEINIYPIKSTRRIALTESEVLPRGLPWDRRWMLVDEQGQFITARQQPKLAMVETCIGVDRLQISVNGMANLHISLQPEKKKRQSVTVWQDTLDVCPVNEAANRWFSDYLATNCRLVQMTDDIIRGVNQDYGQPGDEVSFADGFPLLLIGEASLEDLNQRLENKVSMRRFRPNVVVNGSDAYAEDNWHRLRIGEVEFEGVKACSRCVFTTIDPDTGIKDPAKEPLRTLSTYRRRDGKGVYFGQNLIPRTQGVIRIGDAVELLR
jgi:uncharacterized protein YcbX